MSNSDNNATPNPAMGYYPPYGYPWYPMPPAPQGMGWPQPPQFAQQPPQYPPQMMPGYPPAGYPMPPQPGAAPQQPYHHPHHHAAAQGPDWSHHAQNMVEGMMGEQAGLLKNIISSVGMDDKEFWKGAMIGAAVTLLLTNESVRGTLMQTLAGAGDMLKTGGIKVKDSVKNGTSAVKESASAGATIFRDTVKAGKDGFQESVERHRHPGEPETESEEKPDEQQS